MTRGWYDEPLNFDPDGADPADLELDTLAREIGWGTVHKQRADYARDVRSRLWFLEKEISGGDEIAQESAEACGRGAEDVPAVR